MLGMRTPRGGLDGVVAAQTRLSHVDGAGGRLRLLGVEYIVPKADWDAANPAPPALLGQQFAFIDSPNRFGLDPFYELHVWAWRENPRGTFVDFNPRVSCDGFTQNP